MPAVSLPLPQIITQLQTSWGGAFEGRPRFWSSPSISYAILNLSPAPGSLIPELVGGAPITPTQVSFAAEAFELWDDLIAISMTEVASSFASITFGYSSTTTNNATYATPQVTPSLSGNDIIISQDIWLSTTSANLASANMSYGGFGFETYLHEIGHALGLSHPGSYNASDVPAPTYAASAEYIQDTRQYTVMSYFNAENFNPGIDRFGAAGNYTSASAPLLHDIAAIQALYGADFTTRATDTVYGFNSTAGRGAFDFTLNVDPIIAIWDGGGIDTLDCSGYATNQFLTLIAGQFSSVGALTDNVVIAFNVVFENLIGGSGNDTFQGNAISNVLDGGAGSDTFSAGDGNDTITGGLGNDFAYGGLGDDILIGGGGGDLLYGGAGFDTVAYVSSVGEIVTLTSTGQPNLGLWTVTGPTQASGDSLATIEAFEFGSGNDRITIANAPGARLVTINGAGGNDTIIGSGGPEKLVGGFGTDSIQPLRGVFTVFGGFFNFFSGQWIEAVADHDELIIDRRTDLVGYSFLLTAVSAVGSWVGSDGSTARGIARLDFSGSAFADQVVGGLWNDVLDGNSGNDTLTGRDGNDVLLGDIGDDLLSGGIDNDTLTGGDGNDSLYAGDGDDLITGGLGADVIFAGIGNDRVNTGGGGDLQTFGEAGNDSITGSVDADVIYGGDDLDRLIGLAGNDTLYGGLGDDAIFGGDGDDYIDPGTGVERMDGGLGINFLNLDRSTTSIGVSFFLNGPVGSDGSSAVNFDRMIYRAGSGNDTIVGSVGADIINGNAGNDVLNGDDGNDSLVGGIGDDTLLGGLGVDVLFGGDGNDRIDTGGGGDMQNFGEVGNDTINGSADAETFYGGNDHDSLVGGGGNDTMYGGTGDDAIFGGSGDDFIDPGTGVETLSGGSGINFLTIDRSATVLGVSFFLNGAVGSDGSSAIGFDRMTFKGGSGNDSLSGSVGADTIFGNAGNDALTGNDGNDNLFGGIGDDTLFGGLGVDIIHGDDGNDVITTGGGGDVLTFGDVGNDTITGSADAETFYGGNDLDVIFGGGGNDTLYGGAGNDTLAAGTGSNLMDAGTENDTFVFVNLASTDTIIGFDADPLGGGQDLLDVTAFGFVSFNNMLSSGVSILASGSSTIIDFGAGAPVLTLLATTVASITAADFLF